MLHHTTPQASTSIWFLFQCLLFYILLLVLLSWVICRKNRPYCQNLCLSSCVSTVFQAQVVISQKLHYHMGKVCGLIFFGAFWYFLGILIFFGHLLSFLGISIFLWAFWYFLGILIFFGHSCLVVKLWFTSPQDVIHCHSFKLSHIARRKLQDVLCSWDQKEISFGIPTKSKIEKQIIRSRDENKTSFYRYSWNVLRIYKHPLSCLTIYNIHISKNHMPSTCKTCSFLQTGRLKFV